MFPQWAYFRLIWTNEVIIAYELRSRRATTEGYYRIWLAICNQAPKPKELHPQMWFISSFFRRGYSSDGFIIFSITLLSGNILASESFWCLHFLGENHPVSPDLTFDSNGFLLLSNNIRINSNWWIIDNINNIMWLTNSIR